MNVELSQSQLTGKVYKQILSNQCIFNLSVNDVFGQTRHELIMDKDDKLTMTEMWLKNETFKPNFTAKIHPEIESILTQSSEVQGDMTEAVSIAIETC